MLRVGFCDVCVTRAGWCCSLVAAVKWSVVDGRCWMGDVDGGGAEFGRNMASKAAVMAADTVEMKSSRLGVSAAAANVISGSWKFDGLYRSS